MMFRMVPVLAMTFGLAAVVAMSPAPRTLATPAAIQAARPLDRQAFHDAMRQLWEDHIVWTRQVIVSKLTLPGDLPDLGSAVQRLLQNQADIGRAIAPFYGDAAGEALTQLLTGHIVTAADILTAVKAGDSAAAQAAIAAWYENGDQIAQFLNAANPDAWPLEAMEQMMKDHLDLTLAEAVARFEGRYADDFAAYDEIHQQILHMADMLSDGIVQKFPEKFAGAR